MKIDLQQLSADTHEWELVATFRYSHMAVEAARAFSQWDQHAYRVIDKRFPDEGIEVTLISNGHVTP
jgi:hypothetical protein